MLSPFSQSLLHALFTLICLSVFLKPPAHFGFICAVLRNKWLSRPMHKPRVLSPPNSLRLVNKAKFLGAFVVEGATRKGAVDAANPQPLQNKPALQR